MEQLSTSAQLRPAVRVFSTTYNNAAGGCQTPGLSTSFSNAQGDTATLAFTGVTNSITFTSGPIQPVNYGTFAITYTSNLNDLTPVNIPQSHVSPDH